MTQYPRTLEILAMNPGSVPNTHMEKSQLSVTPVQGIPDIFWPLCTPRWQEYIHADKHSHIKIKEINLFLSAARAPIFKLQFYTV